MAQNQREINRLRHIIEEKDREIEMLRENEDDSGRMDPGITEEFSQRVQELEGLVKGLTEGSGRMDTRIAQGFSQRVNELEGMVKGLTEELLDLKAEVRKLGKVLEGKEELKPKPEVRRARPAPEKMVKRPEESSQPAIRPVEPELGTATIMQPDGTLAQEPRRNDDLIVAGNRPANVYQSKVNREYRGREEKKPLIYADEDDTVEIKKK
ncbi:hypothetical protein L1S32_04750 [Methanogenium sp. S4BF]|uniref:DUF7518 family protein n=1 Tax=Methanogenium sp. S4BF TaxID=1789226 RepID=UPI002415F541|nr:hypothetical protein [Methanogenium sp. S4BF]WFN35425.1 hypothetical protein L1S32_04750 [Methanogenium sp. S4BF]